MPLLYCVVYNTAVSPGVVVAAVPPGLRRPAQIQAREILLSNGGQIDPAAAHHAVVEVAERMQNDGS